MATLEIWRRTSMGCLEGFRDTFFTVAGVSEYTSKRAGPLAA
jgi:hypothetical protein